MKASSFELVLGITNYKPTIGFQFTQCPPCLASQEMETATLPLCLREGNVPSPNFNDHMWIISTRYNLDDNRTANGTRHLIPYCLILTRDNKLVVYRRKGNEDRLNSKWSIGLGGHVSIDTIRVQRKANGYSTVAPRHTIFTTLKQELYEEVGIKHTPGDKPKNLMCFDDEFWIANDLYLLGELNLVNTDVDKLHTGVVFLLRTKYTSHDICITDGAEETDFINFTKGKTSDTLVAHCPSTLEPWSDVVLNDPSVRNIIHALI